MDTYDAVQKAVYDALTAALTPFSCPVYDGAAPDDAVMPYAVIGDHSSDPDDTFRGLYTIHALTIEVYHGPNQGAVGGVRGKGGARRIVAAAKDALHHAKLELAAGRCVKATVERTNVGIDADQVTAIGSLIVRVDVAS